jgi:hypothetical protein
MVFNLKLTCIYNGTTVNVKRWFNEQPEWSTLVQIVRELCMFEPSAPVLAVYTDADNIRTVIESQNSLDGYYSDFTDGTYPRLEIGLHKDIMALIRSECKDLSSDSSDSCTYSTTR